MIKRRRIITTVQSVYESFGFLPLDTPALEYEDILAGKYGAEADKLIYSFEDHGKRRVALRYDLTVPLSRVVSMYPDLPKPFKRYQVAPVWRADKTQKGRYREFVQFDADICGSSSILADAEIAMLIYTVMHALGIDRFSIVLNNRKLINGLVRLAGVPDNEAYRVFHVFDKSQKIGWDAVWEELAKPKSEVVMTMVDELERFEDIEKEPFSMQTIQKLKDYMRMQEHYTSERSSKNPMKDYCGRLQESCSADGEAISGARELLEIVQYLETLGVAQENVCVDISVVRGLDYYTGTVYETILKDRSGFGSVFSGGRFDDLISKFAGLPIPAVGASVGVDRLYAAMQELGLAQDISSNTKVLVAVETGNESMSLEISSIIRLSGVNTELYLGEIGAEKPLRRQLKYAAAQNIPYVVLPFATTPHMVTIRNMASGEQVELLPETVKTFIEQENCNVV